jgi:hypothetical protein
VTWRSNAVRVSSVGHAVLLWQLARFAKVKQVNLHPLLAAVN